MHRPWGWFFTVCAGPTMWVKILTIKPGARLSLQRHHYRTETWATQDYGLCAHIGGVDLDMLPHTRYHVPAGVNHRLINPTAHVCSVVEYAQGRPEEDDIVRLDDIYGRA